MIPPMEPEQPVQPVQPRHFPPPAAQRTVSRQRSLASSSMPPHVSVESSARLWRNLGRWRLSTKYPTPSANSAVTCNKNWKCKAKLRPHLLLSGSAITEVARRRRHMAERSWLKTISAIGSICTKEEAAICLSIGQCASFWRRPHDCWWWNRRTKMWGKMCSQQRRQCRRRISTRTEAFRCLFLRGSYAAKLEVGNDPGLYSFRFKRKLGDFRVQVSDSRRGWPLSNQSHWMHLIALHGKLATCQAELESGSSRVFRYICLKHTTARFCINYCL